MRKCKMCGTEKPLEEFALHSWRNGEPRYKYQCKRCFNQWSGRLLKQKRLADPAEAAKAYSRLKLRHAVLRGDVKRPKECQSCASCARLEAHHHNGYSNSLDVVWLCRKCHVAAHKNQVSA